MQKNYKFTRQAQSDLREILTYIAEDSFIASQKMRGRFFEAFLLIANNPYIGHVREDLTDGAVRFLSVCRHMVIYDPDANPIQIIRILSSSRDIPSLL